MLVRKNFPLVGGVVNAAAAAKWDRRIGNGICAALSVDPKGDTDEYTNTTVSAVYTGFPNEFTLSHQDARGPGLLVFGRVLYRRRAGVLDIQASKIECKEVLRNMFVASSLNLANPAPEVRLTSAAGDRIKQPWTCQLIRRHNESIGRPAQRLIQQAFMLLFAAPCLSLALRLFFKIEVKGREIIDSLGDRSILVCQHYFEWDPFLTFSLLLWQSALTKRHLAAQSLASSRWVSTPLLRLISWICGIMSFIQNHEPRAGAVDRAAQLLNGQEPVSIAIFPTGTIGRQQTYSLHPAVAHLALRSPQTPIVPIALEGLTSVRWRDVLTFKRPRLALAVGTPFTAEEVPAPDERARLFEICSRINDEWKRCMPNQKQERVYVWFERRYLEA